MFSQSTRIGPYFLIRKLGQGGFGEVWLSERRAKFVTTRVAIKLPHDEQVDQEAIKSEATLWAKASGHPNILPIIDADEYDGQIAIVSEFAPDGSLHEWLKKNGTMPVNMAVEMTIKILDGLEYLHSRDIIHRDLKPGNILLQGDTPRLADFGISRALRATASSQTSNVSGTFAYMCPEGFDGKRSEQTDIWSVGVNLYQFLTGRLPFPQKEPSVLIAAIMLRDFDALPPEIPKELQRIIGRALAKRTEDRYVGAAEMRDALQAFLRETNFPASPDSVVPRLAITSHDENASVISEKANAKETMKIWRAVPFLLIMVGAIVIWFYMSAISMIAEDPQIAQAQAVLAIPPRPANRPNANANVAKVEPSPSPEPTIEPKVVKTGDLQKYQGKQISDITKDNEIRGRLKAMLGGNYQIFMKNLNVCPPFTSSGGALTGVCCAPHSCGSEMSYVSLDPSNDKIYCAILSDSLSATGSADAPFNTKLRTFSEKGGTFPQVLASLISKADR